MKYQASLLLLLAGVWSAAGETAAVPSTPEQMNGLSGIPLFSGGRMIWEEDADAVAERLGLPRESLTSNDASYRIYPPEDAKVFGRRAYSVAMSARDGKPTALNIIFANKGDAVGQFVPSSPGRVASRLPSFVLRDYRKAISEDERAITEALASVIGAPRVQKISQGTMLQEKALRWDWNGHAILLVSVRDEYAAVRMVPASGLDAPEDVARVSARDLKARLAGRVERRPNGDVVLRDLPMVDQGPKGFCVPATMERMLRYLGIPADMYLLAVAAHAQPDGGTSIRDILFAVSDHVRRAGFRMVSEEGRSDIGRVSKWIESGLPILWAIGTSAAVDQHISRHTAARAGVNDWKKWATSLKPARRNARRLAREGSEAHLCLIVGFNRETGELALSDSWGPAWAERWITIEEAAAISQGAMAVVSW